LYEGEDWDIQSTKLSLLEDINRFIEKVKIEQIEKIIKEQHAILENDILTQISNLLEEPQSFWKNMRIKIKVIVEKIKNNLIKKLKNFEIPEESQDFQETMDVLTKNINEIILKKMKELSNNLSNVILKKFEEEFKYLPGHMPKIFKDERSIITSFKSAREVSFKILNVFFLFRLNDSNLDSLNIKIPSNNNDPSSNNIVKSIEYPSIENFDNIILTEIDCKKIYDDVSFKIATSYSDQQRNLISKQTSIPAYFYVILLLLGWNELLFIITNPIYLFFSIIGGLIFGVFYARSLIQEFLAKSENLALYNTLKLILGNLPFQILNFDEIQQIIDSNKKESDIEIDKKQKIE
jgi:protein SEY1